MKRWFRYAENQRVWPSHLQQPGKAGNTANHGRSCLDTELVRGAGLETRLAIGASSIAGRVSSSGRGNGGITGDGLALAVGEGGC